MSIMSTGNATAQRDLEKLAEDYDVLKGRTVECVRQSQARQRQFAPQSGGGEDAVGRPQQSQLRETNGASSSHVMIEMQQFSDADDAIAEVRYSSAALLRHGYGDANALLVVCTAAHRVCVCGAGAES